jgi:hypothetical protein
MNLKLFCKITVKYTFYRIAFLYLIIRAVYKLNLHPVNSIITN